MSAATSFGHEPDIVECRRYIDRALASLGTLHLGPLDYNVTQTIDDLLVAVRLLERFGTEHRGE